MADVTLTYKGSTILSMDATASKTIQTGGKFCEGDIGVSYVKPSGGSSGGTHANYFASEAMPDAADGGNGDLYIKGGTFYHKTNGNWSMVSGETAIDSSKSYAHAERTGPNIFGVEWTTGDSSAFTRLTPDNDPKGLVTIKVEGAPEPASGNGAGYSPFDEYLPWSGMEEYNIVNGNITAKQGEAGFSRTAYDTMVFIPEFWIHAESTSDKYRLYLSDAAVSGFTKHPGSGKYIAKYFSTGSYVSKSGSTPLAKMTFDTATSGIIQKGTGWEMLDIEVWSAIQMLYVVEFADWWCREKIGSGYTATTNTAIHNTGGTDSMQYHTGQAAGTDGAVQAQYRHIEDPWGNLYAWVDRIQGYAWAETCKYYSYRQHKNFFRFRIKKTGATDYTDASVRDIYGSKTGTTADASPLAPNPSGYIWNVYYNSKFPWAIIPFFVTGDGPVVGTASTYICAYATLLRAASQITNSSYYDGYNVNNTCTSSQTSNIKVAVGGGYKVGTKASLFCYYANNTGAAVTDIGCRMQFNPSA